MSGSNTMVSRIIKSFSTATLILKSSTFPVPITNSVSRGKRSDSTTPNRTSGVFTWWISTKVLSIFRLLWVSLMESEVNSTTSKLGKAAQSLCAISGSTFHVNHREWNSLFRQTAERHGKLTGYVNSHDKYRHPIFQRRASQMLGSTAGNNQTPLNPAAAPQDVPFKRWLIGSKSGRSTPFPAALVSPRERMRS